MSTDDRTPDDPAAPEFAGEPSADRAHTTPYDDEPATGSEPAEYRDLSADGAPGTDRQSGPDAVGHTASDAVGPTASNAVGHSASDADGHTASDTEAVEYREPVAQSTDDDSTENREHAHDASVEDPASDERQVAALPIAEPLAPASEVSGVPATPEVAPRWEAPGGGSVAAPQTSPRDRENADRANDTADRSANTANRAGDTGDRIAADRESRDEQREGVSDPRQGGAAGPASPVETGAVAYPAAAFIPPPAPFSAPGGRPEGVDQAISRASTPPTPSSSADTRRDDQAAGGPVNGRPDAVSRGDSRGANAGFSADSRPGREAAGETAGTGSYPAPNFAQPTAIAVPILIAPKRRSNRGFGLAITLLATVVFAIVYALVGAAILAFSVDGSRLLNVVGQFAASPAFYVPVIFFALALALTVLIVNRAGWWAYVLGGFLIAVVVYGAAILGALLAVQAWTMNAGQVSTFISSLVMDPLTLAAALVAREVPIWAGAWIAAHGRKVKAKNLVAREEYERKLSETPIAQYPTGAATS